MLEAIIYTTIFMFMNWIKQFQVSLLGYAWLNYNLAIVSTTIDTSVQFIDKIT